MTHRWNLWAVVALLLISANVGLGAGIKEKQLDSVYTAEVFKRGGTVAATGAFDLGGFKITNGAAGTAAGDFVIKSQLDAASAGLDPKASVRVTETGILDDNTDITGAPTYNNVGGTSARGQITATLAVSGNFTIDSVDLASTNRILIQGEGGVGGLGADANGIYVATITGTSLVLDRATDFDADAEVSAGAYAFVEEGTLYTGTGWVLVTPDPITIGGATGTSLSFSKFSSLALYAATPTTVNGGDAGAAGSSALAARGDHEHPVATAVAGTIAPDDAAAEGASTSLARADHLHAIAAAAPSGSLVPDDANAEGVATSFARSDHDHGIAAGVPGAIAPDDVAAEGVGTSFARNDHTHGIVAAVAGAISPDDTASEGVATSFSRSDHQHAITADVAVSVGTANAEGAAATFARSNHVHDSGVSVLSNKDAAPSATAGDDSDSGLTIAATPANDAFVQVLVNGVMYSVGDGVDTKCSYFADAGAPTIPKAISAIVATDHFIWNGTTCGFNLETSDRVDFVYESF